MMNQSKKRDESLPIVELWHAIVRHKKVSIGILTLVIAVLCGSWGYSFYKERKEARRELEHSLSHLTEIVGTYSNSRVKLELHADHTAVLTTDLNMYGEQEHLGHWREKMEDYPIEIDFSESFEASLCGKYDHYFGSLYFFGNALWPNMDAIQSADVHHAELLTKQ